MRATIASPGTASRQHTGLVPDAALIRRIVTATLVVGTLDGLFGVIIYIGVAGRYNLETLLQYIGTGLLGHGAFRDGAAGIGTAALGGAAHFGLSAGFAAAFALTVGRLIRTRTLAVIVGAVYGAGVWILMANAVLPALNVAHEPFGGRYWWAFLADHAVFIGLPIALLTSQVIARAKH